MLVAENEILGRDLELAELEHFLDDLGAGSVNLLIEGEPGVGKSILWEHGLSLAADRGYRVLTCRPAEAETKLSYVSLGDLFEDSLDEALPTLPDPQRRSLEIALLRIGSTTRTPDRRAVSVAALACIRSLANSRPLMIAIDDLQWLDLPTRRIIEFLVRRLQHERIGMFVTRRTEAGRVVQSELDGAASPPRRMNLGSIDAESIARLLRGRIGTEVSRPILRRLYEMSGGNPFFALEIGRALQREENQTYPGEALPISGELQALLRSRLAELPAAARAVLPAPAATARATPDLIRALLDNEGLAGMGLKAAEEAGVFLVSEGQVRFTHPLLGSAVYAELSAPDRRALHRRLGELVDESEERARHLALASEGPDADVASALDDAARTALARGAPDAAADLAELAIGLTPAGSTTTRPCYGRDLRVDAATERRAGAAVYHFQAGDVPRARALMNKAAAAAEPGPLRAGVLLRLSAISWNDVKQCSRLLEQALPEATGNLHLMTEIRSELAWVGILGGDLALGVDHARAALTLATKLSEPNLIAMAAQSLGYAEFLMGQPVTDLMTRAMSLQESLEGLDAYGTPRLYLAQQMIFSGDLDRARKLLQDERRWNVDRGQESMTWDVLAWLTILESRAGNWALAVSYGAEAYEITIEVGHDQALGPALTAAALIEALTGQVEDARGHARKGLRLSERLGDRFWESQTAGVLGFLELSLGNYAQAAEYLSPLPDLLETMGVREPGAFPFVPDLVEALVALGDLDRAETLVVRLEEQGTELDRALALATAARCRGLLAASRGDVRRSMEAFSTAMQEHTRLTQPFELARTLLALGEVQRRCKQRKAAREALTAALRIFDRLGSPIWSQRARSDLARIAGRRPGPADRLTLTEKRVAELAANGHTNREIAGALFISTKTVEANLTRVYQKLGIRSRRELQRRASRVESDSSAAAIQGLM